MGQGSDPVAARAAALEAVATLRAGGHVAYFNGGCVRDELLALKPTDYDVATDATPARVKELFKRVDLVGAAFGVSIVRLDAADADGQYQHVAIEIATFRADGPYTDRRRPDTVSFSDPRTDAARRDFTINAMFLDPMSASHTSGVRGEVIDFFGGLSDLKAGVIRAVGDPERRLAEDHLRALRAARFAARMNFTIEPATAAAIRKHAAELTSVSRERIGEEVRRMLRHASRARAMECLVELGLLKAVLGVQASPASFHRLSQMPTSSAYATALAALALDLDATRAAGGVHQLVSTWRQRLNLSNQERDDVAGMLVLYECIVQSASNWLNMPVARRKRLAASDWFPDIIGLISSTDRLAAEAVQRDADWLASTLSGLRPDPLVSGDDLISVGFRPSAEFRRVLEGVYDAQLEDRIRDKEEALRLARELWGQRNV